jgi:hypothetical protein
MLCCFLKINMLAMTVYPVLSMVSKEGKGEHDGDNENKGIPLEDLP